MNKERTEYSRAWMEARRLRAWELLQKGWKQIEVAEALGVSRGAVSRWGPWPGRKAPKPCGDASLRECHAN